MPQDADVFESSRRELLALAYRMLGDLARAEDMVQEAWIRWQQRHVEAESPRAFLVTIVTRLCLDELGSARARREESRSDRLPEPVSLEESGLPLGRVEVADRISMAFLVLLQRLTPAERAVLLLHDVFDMEHAEIAALLEKSEAACRQLLARARDAAAAERRALRPSREEHRRLLLAFVQAVNEGKREALEELLTERAVLTVDAGPQGATFGRVRNVGRPVEGRTRIAALLAALTRQSALPEGPLEERDLNGEPAVVIERDGRTFAAILVSIEDGRIAQVFVHLDPERLRHVASRA